jgi:hypothetical protein
MARSWASVSGLASRCADEAKAASEVKRRTSSTSPKLSVSRETRAIEVKARPKLPAPPAS